MKRASVCVQCGTEFEASRSDAKLCSGRCRVARHRNTPPRRTDMNTTTFRKLVAAAAIAFAAMTVTAGNASADRDPGAVYTENDDNWGSGPVTPESSDYTWPGIAQCGEGGLWIEYTITGYDKDGDPIWSDVCHYGTW